MTLQEQIIMAEDMMQREPLATVEDFCNAIQEIEGIESTVNN